MSVRTRCRAVPTALAHLQGGSHDCWHRQMVHPRPDLGERWSSRLVATARRGLLANALYQPWGRASGDRLAAPSIWMTPASAMIPTRSNKLSNAKQAKGTATASDKSRLMAGCPCVRRPTNRILGRSTSPEYAVQKILIAGYRVEKRHGSKHNVWRCQRRRTSVSDSDTRLKPRRPLTA